MRLQPVWPQNNDLAMRLKTDLNHLGNDPNMHPENALEKKPNTGAEIRGIETGNATNGWPYSIRANQKHHRPIL